MRYPVAVAVIIAVLASAAHAETVRLNEVLERTLKASPAAARVEHDYQDKLAEGTATATLDNPELQTDFLRKNRDGGNELEVELSQPLRLSHVNGARRSFAEALTRAATTEQKYTLLKTVNDISTLYMKLWALQERKALYEKSAKDAAGIAGAVRAAVRQGQTAPSESTLFTADSLRLETEIDSIAAEIEQTRLELTRATGFSFAAIDAVKPDFSIVPPPERLVAFSRARATLRTITRDHLAASEARLKAAEADSFPEFGPRLLYNRGFGGNDERALGAGISMRIPLWDTNRAERQRAQAAVNAARAEADSVAGQKPEEAIAALGRSAARLQMRERKYWNEIVPAYRKSYDLSRRMLRAGQIQALGLWQLREKLYQIEEAALQSTLDAYAARLALELEIGGKLEEVGAGD